MRISPTNAAAIPPGTPLVIAGFADQALADYVSAGGRCLLFSHGAASKPSSTSFETAYRTIPWNAGPGNCGTVVTKHPALDSFPHDEFCDLQFVYLIRDASPIEFTPLKPCGVQPIVRSIDWYQSNRDKAYAIEFSMGRGKVLATSFNILPRMAAHLEVRDFASRMADYALSDRFRPAAQVPATEFLKLFSAKSK